MMNKNKTKYISVPQDSFKFSPIRANRQDSEEFEAADKQKRQSINDRARINEISLVSRQNEADFEHPKFFYTLIELLAYTFGFIVTLASLATCVWFYMYSDLPTLVEILIELKQEKLLEIEYILVYAPIIYLAIEIGAFVLDLFKQIVIFRVLGLVRLSKQPDLDSDEEYSDDSINSTIGKLKLRCFIRNKLSSLLSCLSKLEIIINSYFLLFVIAAKFVLAGFLSFKINSLINCDLIENNFSFRNESKFSKNFNCCNSLSYGNETEDFCAQNFSDSTRFFYFILIILLYSTAIIKLFTQITLYFNFKYYLTYRLIKSFKKDDEDLLIEYNQCQTRLERKEIQNKLEQSRDYFADNFLNINTLEKNGKSCSNSSSYVNVNKPYEESEERYLNDEEQNAIDLIDQATTNDYDLPNTIKSNTFKINK